MEVVKSPLEQEVAVVAAKQAQTEAARAYARKRFAFSKRQLTGKLTFAEFKTLSPANRKAYVKTFGRPKTDDQIIGAKKTLAKRHRRNKISRKSRAVNRRVGR